MLVSCDCLAAVLLARPGVTRVTRAFGSVLRQARNTTRNRGAGVTQLAQWNDNQGAYSWWTVGPDQEVGKQACDMFLLFAMRSLRKIHLFSRHNLLDRQVWGKPEDIYVKMKDEYDKSGIPVRSWEPDNK
eukprot:SAG31_NODE_6910_length_1853_cov_6.956455_3_plen_130_part_00